MDEKLREELGRLMAACLEGVQALDEAQKMIEELKWIIAQRNASADITIGTLVMMAGGRVEISEKEVKDAASYELHMDESENRVVYSVQRQQVKH